MSKQTWQEIAANKKQEQTNKLPKEWLIAVPPNSRVNVLSVPRECGLLSAEEIEITESSVDDLLRKLARKGWTSVQVTSAFYKRAIIAHQVVNCLTEIYIERALKWAAERDEYLASTGRLMGSLHGLPVSVKDQFCITGLDTVMGYVSWVGVKAEKNAVLVDMLLSAGAVPFVRTNVPQTLMWPETYNIIFGLTCNPANRSLTAGGSSGGEGALIAMRGSPIGVGSDIAGSIRIPADFNGLFGLRPSYDRIPYQDALNSAMGQESIPSVFGPLCPSIEGIKAFFKAILDGKPWLRDPYSPRLPWSEDLFQLKERNGGKGLVFGFLWNDTQITPHPPIQRAMRITKDALAAAGHKVVDWSGDIHPRLYNVAGAIWGADGGEDYRAVTAPTGEPILQSQRVYSEGDNPIPPAFRESAKLSSFELWQVQREKRALRKEYLDAWQATASSTGTGRPVDAIISPVAPFAAPPHGDNTSAAYTLVWNVLDYPACTFPVLNVDPVQDVKTRPHGFLGPRDEEHHNMYDPQKFIGAPVGLQLVGHTHEDEAVIAMTSIVSKAVQSFLHTSK